MHRPSRERANHLPPRAVKGPYPGYLVWCSGGGSLALGIAGHGSRTPLRPLSPAWATLASGHGFRAGCPGHGYRATAQVSGTGLAGLRPRRHHTPAPRLPGASLCMGTVSALCMGCGASSVDGDSDVSANNPSQITPDRRPSRTGVTPGGRDKSSCRGTPRPRPPGKGHD